LAYIGLIKRGIELIEDTEKAGFKEKRAKMSATTIKAFSSPDSKRQ